MKSKHLLSAGALCLASAICHSATLSTFATNDVFDQNVLTMNKARIKQHNNMLFGNDFASNMKVSNNGTVVYIDATLLPAVWSKETGQTQSQLEGNFLAPIDITNDGKSFSARGKRYDFNTETNLYEPSIWAGGITLMSSDGSLRASWTTSYPETPKPLQRMADYPYYYVNGEHGIPFGSPGSIYDPALKPFHKPNMETFLRAPYQDLYLIDIDGANEVFLANQDALSLVPEGQLSSSIDAQRDIILMDKGGRFLSESMDVIYPVELSHNGQHVLAYDINENCPSYDETHPNRCAILWNRDNSITPLGNFLPHAMSGDATLVVGRTNDTPFTNEKDATAVIWDATNGTRSFVEAMTEEGVNLSAWTDIYVLDISQDGSKIAGHGLNAQGIREGFLIERNSHEENLWTRVESSSTDIISFFNWGESNVNNDHDQSMKVSDAHAAKLTYTFTGDQIRVQGSRGLSNGYYNVYIDNVFWESIDTFDCAETYSDLLFDSGYLGEGEHTIIIEVGGRQHLSSQGRNIGIDAFEVKTFTPTSSTAYSNGNIPAATFQHYDANFDMDLSLGDPADLPAFNEQNCYGLTCTNEWYRWTDYLFNARLVQPKLSDIINADGSFSAEVWFRDTGGTLMSLQGLGKYFVVWVENPYMTGQDIPNDLRWTGKAADAPINPLDYRHTESEIAASYPMGTGGYADYGLSWNHVMISGNWQNGDIKIYLNGELAGEAVNIDSEFAVEDLLLLGRPAKFDQDSRNMRGQVAKLASYDEELNHSQALELYEWPTSYGLPFAPNTSPEYSTRMPGCSQGCEPGLDGTVLSIMNGGSTGVPISTGGF